MPKRFTGPAVRVAAQKISVRVNKQLIAANLTLTDGEATKFWPVYEQYSADFREDLRTRETLIIKEVFRWLRNADG